MDGFEVLRELRARGSTIPVIMLTARSSTRDTVEGLDAEPTTTCRSPSPSRSCSPACAPGCARAPPPAGVSRRARRRRARHPRAAVPPSAAARSTCRRASSRSPSSSCATPVGCSAASCSSAACGAGLRPGLERRRRLRALPARQARRRPHRDGARRRLPLGVSAGPRTKKPPVLGDTGGWEGPDWGIRPLSIALGLGNRAIDLSSRRDRRRCRSRRSSPHARDVLCRLDYRVAERSGGRTPLGVDPPPLRWSAGRARALGDLGAARTPS